jgi:hypothetical protein
MEDDCWSIEALRECEQLGGYHRGKEEFNGDGAILSHLEIPKERAMKLTTIALAIAFTVPSTFALAQGGMSIGSHSPAPSQTPAVRQAVLQSDPGISLGIRLLLSRMIQADQH